MTPVMNEFVIFYSGDGGWAPLEQRVSDNLNERGYGVLGISTLAYFWREQPVAESAAELDDLIEVYRQKWNAPRVWLIGFSFGANVLPSIVNQLKPEHRARVSQLTLLEPTEDVFLEIELERYMTVGWLNRISQTYRHMRQPVTHHDPFPALYQLEGQIPVNCFQTTKQIIVGLCSLPSFPDWIITTESHGNHYFNGDFDTLAQRLIEQHPTAAAGP
jgi:type IV secretory pathway VirJ component